MSVSYYDLLDVAETASVEEIRAAWKAAVADLDPTDRRFRAYNDAAAVLLDADKRASYDVELAAARAEDEVAAEPQPEVVAEAAAEPELKQEIAPVEIAGAASATAKPDAPDALDAPVRPATKGAIDAPPPVDERARVKSGSREVPGWAVAVAAGLAVVSLVLMIVVLSWPGSLGGDSPKSQESSGSSAEDAGKQAEDAAAVAVPVVLSYDYRTLDADFAEAAKYLTPDFAQQRSDLFAQKTDGGTTLRDQVVADKVVVTAVVPGTGLTRVSSSGDRATVVVYVDQESQRGDSAPRTLQMWATLSMVADGGDWLIDDICTESDCS